MVVDGYREHLLGAVLADDVRVQVFIDLRRCRQLGQRQTRLCSSGRGRFFVDDLSAQVHALVADIDRSGPCDQPPDLILAFATE